MLFSLRRRPDGTLELPYVSAQSQHYWGVAPESLQANVGQFWGAIHPEDTDNIRRNKEGSARTLNPPGTEFRVKHPVRGEIWAQTRSTPTREADGSILWSGFIEDVTDRRRAERALVESERRYRHLIENMQSGIAYCRMEYENDQPVDFTFVDVNAAFDRSGQGRGQARYRGPAGHLRKRPDAIRNLRSGDQDGGPRGIRNPAGCIEDMVCDVRVLSGTGIFRGGFRRSQREQACGRAGCFLRQAA